MQSGYLSGGTERSSIFSALAIRLCISLSCAALSATVSDSSKPSATGTQWDYMPEGLAQGFELCFACHSSIESWGHVDLEKSEGRVTSTSMSMLSWMYMKEDSSYTIRLYSYSTLFPTSKVPIAAIYIAGSRSRVTCAQGI